MMFPGLRSMNIIVGPLPLFHHRRDQAEQFVQVVEGHRLNGRACEGP